MQLQPFLDAYGFENVLPVFFPRLVNALAGELERIGRFLGHDGALEWDSTLKPQNQGMDRLRPSPIREVLVQAPVLSTLRQRVVPRDWSQSLKEFWRAELEPPAVPPDLTARPARRLRRRPCPARLLAGHARSTARTSTRRPSSAMREWAEAAEIDLSHRNIGDERPDSSVLGGRRPPALQT